MIYTECIFIAAGAGADMRARRRPAGRTRRLERSNAMWYRLICAALAAAAAAPACADVPPAARDLHRAGVVLGDRAKLLRAWDLAHVPEIAAALTDVWLFEAEPNLDEELVGTPPFLQVLAEWEEREPDNGLPACLRELFHAQREPRFPDWAHLGETLAGKRRIFFHYGEARRASLRFLLDARGNEISTWLQWLDRPQIQNAHRFAQLIQLALIESRFLLLSGKTDEAARRLAVADRAAGACAEEEDEITLRKLGLAGAVLQERILFDLSAGDIPAVEKDIADYRALLGRQAPLLARLSALSNLHGELSDAFRRAYDAVRPAVWKDTAGVDAGAMTQFAAAFEREGTAAIDVLFTYKPMPIDDFTKELEGHMDVFREAEAGKEAAGRFMDFLREHVSSDRGIPTWVIPAYLRVVRAHPDPASLGTRAVPAASADDLDTMLGALAFLSRAPEDTGRWIRAFRRGKARPYLLLAFAKWGCKEAVPAVLEEYCALSERTPQSLLIDYALCLRALTGRNLGLDADAWDRWYKESRDR